MNANLKLAALSVFPAVFLFAGFEANASAVLNNPAGVSQGMLAPSAPQEELAGPLCDLAPLMKLTGAGGRSHAGSREEGPRSAPATVEPPIFVKNPFLPTVP
jgi:hypothetical protein